MSISSPQLSTEEMRLRNCIASIAEVFPISLAGDEKSLSFVTEHAGLENPAISLAFAIEGNSVTIQLDNSILTEQQHTDHGVSDFPNLPESLRQLLIERAISADLDLFESWSGHALDSGSDNAHPPSGITIPFQISDGIRGVILAKPEAAEVLLTCFEKLPKAETKLPDQPVNLAIELGRTQLALAEFKNLATRDVILIENGPAISQGQVEIRPSPNTLFKATLTETEITIQEIMTMSPDDPEPETEASKIDVSDVPIDLVFEIGRQQVSVAELEEIKPGTTLPLEHSLDDSLVTIRANGKFVATGELVQIGDQVGVRLQ